MTLDELRVNCSQKTLECFESVNENRLEVKHGTSLGEIILLPATEDSGLDQSGSSGS